MNEDPLDGLLARLEHDATSLDQEGLAAADAVPLAQLTARLDREDEPAGCELAWLLARRHEPRGIAYLARAATIPIRAGRALRYLELLDMLDMVPPECLTPEYRDRVEAIGWLGEEPLRLEELARGEQPWPGPERLADILLYRFKLPARPVGLLLLRPARGRVDGGVAGLDAYDALSLACGESARPRVPRLDSNEVPRDRLRAVLKRQAYRYLSEPELAGAWQLASEVVLVVAAKSNRKPGYLIGGATGRAPTHWLAAPEQVDGTRLSGEQAFALWYGRLLLAGWR